MTVVEYVSDKRTLEILVMAAMTLQLVMNVIYIKAPFINHRVQREILITQEILDTVNSDSENSASYNLLEMCKRSRRYTNIIRL